MKDPTRTMRLVERAKRGDEAAVNDLFRRYYDRVHQHARRRVGERLRRDVDSQDIAQDSLLVASRKLREFDMVTRSSLMRWLRAIIENQIRDRAMWQAAERRDRGREVAIQDLDGSAVRGVEGRGSPLEALSRKERRERIEALLDQLEPRYSELIRARHFEGLRWEQIAARFGRPSADAARMMYHKAVIELGELARRRAVSPEE